jgi:hypothetical protein
MTFDSSPYQAALTKYIESVLSFEWVGQEADEQVEVN